MEENTGIIYKKKIFERISEFLEKFFREYLQEALQELRIPGRTSTETVEAIYFRKLGRFKTGIKERTHRRLRTAILHKVTEGIHNFLKNLLKAFLRESVDDCLK